MPPPEQHIYLVPNASVQVLPHSHGPAHPALPANKFEVLVAQLVFVFKELWEKTGVVIPIAKREKIINFFS